MPRAQDLQEWMDKSTHGVVCFTLGSMVLIETLPAEQLKEIYSSFGKISPVRVLMKVTDASKLPAGLPSNVKVLPWMPQQKVLGEFHFLPTNDYMYTYICEKNFLTNSIILSQPIRTREYS